MKIKHFVFISLLALNAGMPMTASAQDAGFYIGGAVGRAETDNDTASLTALGATVTSNDEKDTGWKLFGGYQFTKHWGIEASYVDLGDFGAAGTVGALPFTASANVKGYSITGTGTLPLSDKFSLFGKFGAVQAKIKSSATVAALSAATSDNETGWTAGIGIKYDLTKNVAIRAEFDRYDLGDSGDANLYTIGVQFKF